MIGMTKSRAVALLLASSTMAAGIAATANDDTNAPVRAEKLVRSAEKALGKHRAWKAVEAAEAAVALQPRNARYRVVLGKAYLMAGRFSSASAALNDAVTLDPSNGEAALNLALAQIATGSWGQARTTLTKNEGTIAPADRGLALALAGDPVAAVTVLTAAAREPGADAKTRQNLALSLALAGQWQQAKTVAALDVAPAEVDKRIMQWATFARPQGAADQVAALLGVTPVEDAGQPQRLALNTSAPTVAAVVQKVDPVDAYMPAQVASAEPTPVAEATPAAEPAATAEVAEEAAVTEAKAPTPVIAAAPVVAPTPMRPAVRTIAAPRFPYKMAAAVRPVTRTVAWAPERGGFHVQLGAFENAAVARDAWGRMQRSIGALKGMAPAGMPFVKDGTRFYRLSVGGFSRGDANVICARVRARGGRCFVRANAGDQVAAWWKNVQLASR
jgi:Flp pilus assembly protein TadD